MAAEPLGILVAIVLPTNGEIMSTKLQMESRKQPTARPREYLGGDLSDGRDLSLVITVIGNTANPLRRSGARAGAPCLRNRETRRTRGDGSRADLRANAFAARARPVCASGSPYS